MASENPGASRINSQGHIQGHLLVVMGVSGCGKSTIAAALGAALRLKIQDGDDLHSAQSISKMHSGVALDDADRWPWLDRIANYLAAPDISDTQAGHGQGKVVACSALKLAYRDRIRRKVPDVRFIFLDGDSELIRSRMALRQGHFMQPDLLDSQLRTLERPSPDEKDVIRIETGLPVAQVVAQIKTLLSR